MTAIPASEIVTHAAPGRLGPEPLARTFDSAALPHAVRRRTTSLQVALSDQRVVAGPGNIYVSEALHRARLSPKRAASTLVTRTGEPRPALQDLVTAILDVLKEAIRHPYWTGGDDFSSTTTQGSDTRGGGEGRSAGSCRAAARRSTVPYVSDRIHAMSKLLRDNRVLWTLQILLAALYLFAGVFKILAAPDQMRATPADPIPSPGMVAFLRLIGGFEVLGALGLILPGCTGSRRHLTSVAALCLAIMMAGAIVVSIAQVGVTAAIMPSVAGVLNLIVMRGRRGWR